LPPAPVVAALWRRARAGFAEILSIAMQAIPATGKFGRMVAAV
jgi:hypothetical protein